MKGKKISNHVGAVIGIVLLFLWPSMAYLGYGSLFYITFLMFVSYVVIVTFFYDKIFYTKEVVKNG
jgi:hypothetical protein